MISISPMDSYRIIQRDTTSGDAPGSTATYGKGWGAVELSVSSDQETPLSYRIVDGTDPSRIIQDWTSTGQSSSIGNGSVEIKIDASTDCYVVQLASSSDTTTFAQSTPFFVGNVDAAAGQSKASAFFGAYAYPQDYSQAQPSLYSVAAPFSARVFSDTNGNPFDATPMVWQQPGDYDITNGGAVSTFPATYLSLREAELGVACGLVGLAKPGSAIEDWQPETTTYWFELQALLAREGNKINSFIWNQGDSDWSSALASTYKTEFQNFVSGLDRLVGSNYHLFSFDYMWIGGMQPDRFVTQVDLAKAEVSSAHSGSFFEGVSAGADYFGGHPTMLARILGAEDLFRQVLETDDPTADKGPSLTGAGTLQGNTAVLQVRQDKGESLSGQVTDFASTTFSIRPATATELVSQFSAFDHGFTDSAHEIGITSVSILSPTQVALTLDQNPTGAIDVWYRADYGTPGNANAAIRDDITEFGVTYGHQLQTRLTPVIVGGTSISSLIPDENSNEDIVSKLGPTLDRAITPTQVLQVSPSGFPAANPQTTPVANFTENTGQSSVIYRFFDQSTGVHVYTSDPSEFSKLPNFISEQNDFGDLSATAIETDPNACSVFRLFDIRSGSHFFTSSQSELNGLIDPTSSSYRPDLVYEPSSTFIDHSSPVTGDVAVYRFFDKSDGNHFFTSSLDEAAGLQDPGSVTYRSDLTFEGAAFYAPKLS